MRVNAPIIDLEEVQEIAIQDEFNLSVLELAQSVIVQKIGELPVVNEIFQKVLRTIAEVTTLPQVKITDDQFKARSRGALGVTHEEVPFSGETGISAMKTLFRVVRFADYIA